MAPVDPDTLAARYQELVDVLLSFSPKNFDPFDIYRTHYGSDGVQIGVDILVPKSGPVLEKRPAIVRIHGGFLVTGSSLFPAWFSNWILQYAIMHGAVIISPNYRLLPEVKGIDILNDFRNFWSWFSSGSPQQHLENVGRSDVHLDLDKHLLIGESAGGYLAVQSVLSGMVRPHAMVLLYPMLDMKSDYYNKAYEKAIVGVPNFPNNLIDEFVASMNKTTPVTEVDPPSRLDLAIAMVHNGRVLEFLGQDPELFPLEKVLEAKPSSAADGRIQSIFPPILVTHGKDDSAVPAQGSRTFVERLERVDPYSRVHFVMQPGDHGFDAFSNAQDPWLSEALSFVTKEWLGCANSKI